MSEHTKSNGRRNTRDKQVEFSFNDSGSFRTDSDRKRASGEGPAERCARDGKWITSLAAIVASLRGDGGQGRVGVSAPARPARSLS
jgi:hypothetical protein